MSASTAVCFSFVCTEFPCCMQLQVGAYAFACQRGRWPFHYKAVCLLPLMDMLNHRRDGQSNAVVDQNENGTYSCYAKRDIKAGEEVAAPSHLHKEPSHAQSSSHAKVSSRTKPPQGRPNTSNYYLQGYRLARL